MSEEIDPVRALEIMIHSSKANPTDGELQAMLHDALQVKDYLGISVAVRITEIILDDPNDEQRNRRATSPEFRAIAKQYGPIMDRLNKREKERKS